MPQQCIAFDVLNLGFLQHAVYNAAIRQGIEQDGDGGGRFHGRKYRMTLFCLASALAKLARRQSADPQDAAPLYLAYQNSEGSTSGGKFMAYNHVLWQPGFMVGPGSFQACGAYTRENY